MQTIWGKGQQLTARDIFKDNMVMIVVGECKCRYEEMIEMGMEMN